MRVAHIPAGLTIAAWMGVLFVGCRSLPPAWDPTGEVTQPVALEQERAVQADVLAYYSQGLIHDLYREYDAALTNYLQAVALDPANEPLTFRIAMGLLHRQRPDEAVQLMENLKTRHPNSPRVRLWLAWVYRAADRTDDASETYTELLALQPSDAASYMDAAAFYLGLKRREEAIATLERGLRHAKDKLDLLTTLGKLNADEARAGSDEKQQQRALRRAIALYVEAEEIAPDDTETLAKLGDLYILDGKPEKAIPLFSRIEKERPDDLKMKQRLAASFMAVGNIDEAIAKLEEISRKSPTNAQIYYYLGELYQQKGDRDAAILNLSLAAAAGDAPAPVVRLSLLLLEDEPGEAVRVLREGLEKKPAYPRYLSLLAYALLRDGQTDASLAAFAKAESGLSEEERSGAFYYNYGLACHRGGETNRAVQYLTAAVDENLGFIEMLLQELTLGDGDAVEEGIALMARLAEHYPDQAAITLCLGMLQTYAEHYGGALETFAKTETIAELSAMGRLLLNAEFYFNYAAAAERNRDYERAEDLFLKTLELDPSHTHALNYLAYMWAERGVNIEEAGKKATAALAIEPDNAAFIDTLGWIRYQEGRYEEALEEVERAASILSEDATIIDHLGDIYDKLGRDQEALIHWQRSFILDPTSESVRAKLEARDVDLAPLEEQAEERRETLAAQEGRDTDAEQDDVPPPSLPNGTEEDAGPGT